MKRSDKRFIKPLILLMIFLIAAAEMTLISSAFADSSIAGPTGLFLTPSPAVCKPGKFNGAVYWQGYSIQRNGSQSNSNFMANGLYGISKELEVGFSKKIDTMQSSYDPGLSLNLKYLFPDAKALKIAAGMVVETDNNSYSSAYIVAGKDVAYFGLGTNFGGHRAYPLNMAHYGGYNFTDMAPQNFYFLAGANFDLKIAQFTVEYNSDMFSIGFRVPTVEGYNINLAYTSDSDYDILHRYTYGDSYKRQQVTLGVSGTF